MQFSNLMAWLLKGSTSQDLRLEMKVLALQVMLVIFKEDVTALTNSISPSLCEIHSYVLYVLCLSSDTLASHRDMSRSSQQGSDNANFSLKGKLVGGGWNAFSKSCSSVAAAKLLGLVFCVQACSKEQGWILGQTPNIEKVCLDVYSSVRRFVWV